jgi:hypothetical protein
LRSPSHQQTPKKSGYGRSDPEAPRVLHRQFERRDEQHQAAKTSYRQCALTGPYFTFATMDSRASAFRTIVPLRRMGSGRLSLQRAPGAYAAVKSHKNPLRSQQSGRSWPVLSAFLMTAARTWPGSQNCRTRRSLRRSSTLVPGALQSVGRIGSHTAKTTTGLSGWFFRIFSIAEAPRRQVGQVGESNRITRNSADVRLNSDCTPESAALFIWTSGG